MVIRALGSLATSIGCSVYSFLVLVLLPMVIEYFNGYTCARSFGIAAQIKINGEPSLVFSGHWFNFIRLPSEKYKIISWKKKYFEDLEDLLVSFRFYFIITEDSLYISTMYYLILQMESLWISGLGIIGMYGKLNGPGGTHALGNLGFSSYVKPKRPIVEYQCILISCSWCLI
jgi:hypothetical protein